MAGQGFEPWKTHADGFTVHSPGLFRSLNTSRQHDTTTNNERLQLRKEQVITVIHEHHYYGLRILGFEVLNDSSRMPRPRR